MKAIDKAVRQAGGQKALADSIGAKRSFVYQWIKGLRPVPIAICPKIETATGIRCEELRPDVEWIRGKRGFVTAYQVDLAAEAA